MQQQQQQQGGAASGAVPPPPRDPYEGTWEVLSLEPADGGGEARPLLSRHDVWGYHPAQPVNAAAGQAGGDDDDGGPGGGGGGGGGGGSGSQRPAGLPRFGI